MYTIKRTVTVRSHSGKVFTRMQKFNVYSEEERAERSRHVLNRVRERDLMARAEERYRDEKALHPSTLSDIVAAYDEYVRNVRDFEY